MPEQTGGTLRWSAYEHEHIERGSDWYWALGIIAVCAAVTSILFGNFLFALLIVVAAFTIGIIAQQPPELHEFELSEKGIRIGKDFHSYDTMLSFWVDDEIDEPLLLVDTTKFLSPNLIIPVGDMHPDTIRDFLRPHVEEVPMKEPIAHKILEFFGF
ncbi:MAG TPA: hypothetical protein VNM40_03930 [Candidatus Paceibacterota bacterium]|nr:hypothetical protein [Candidatus Paceibacterota bacterium]